MKKELSITEEYALLVMEHFHSFGSEQSACLFASAFMELILDGYLELDDKKRVVIEKELNSDEDYLSTIFNLVKDAKKPKTLKSWLSDLVLNGSNKPMKKMIEMILNNLIEKEMLMEVEKKGLFRTKKILTIKNDSADFVVQKLRATVLEDENFTDEAIILIALLTQSKFIKKYFSKYEMSSVNERLKNLKETEEYENIRMAVAVVDEFYTMIAVIAAT